MAGFKQEACVNGAKYKTVMFENSWGSIFGFCGFFVRDTMLDLTWNRLKLQLVMFQVGEKLKLRSCFSHYCTVYPSETLPEQEQTKGGA